MITDNHYHNSLLFLSYLIMSVDGIVDDDERKAIKKICEFENITESSFKSFMEVADNLAEKQIYEAGIDEISNCTDEEKLRVFAWLHRISEADGHVHVKEVRFLLYSIKKAGIEFNEVLKTSASLPSLLS